MFLGLFFFSQNQVTKIIIRMGLVIYQIEALSVVIRMALKVFKNFSQYREKRVENV